MWKSAPTSWLTWTRFSSFDPPHQGEEVSVEQLQVIAQAIEAEFDRLGLVVAFE